MVTQSHRFHIDTGVRRNIAESVLRHLNVFTDHAVHDLLSELGAEVPPPLHRLLHASVRSNIRIFGELLQTGESMDRAKPSRAIAQFTRVLAQNRVPLHRLIFMYHCAHNSLERQLLPLIETVCRTHTGSPQASEFFMCSPRCATSPAATSPRWSRPWAGFTRTRRSAQACRAIPSCWRTSRPSSRETSRNCPPTIPPWTTTSLARTRHSSSGPRAPISSLRTPCASSPPRLPRATAPPASR